MRKWLLVVIAIILLLVAGVYLLLPKQHVVASFALVGAGQNSVYRCLSDKSCLQNWWYDSAAQKAGATAPLQKEGYQFQFVPQLGNVVTVQIKEGATLIPSSMAIMALQADSAAVEWKATLPATNNFFKKVAHYFEAQKLQQCMAAQLQRLQQFIVDDNQLYGLDVKGTKVTDTLVVTTSVMTDHYPAVADYYALVQQLKNYIAAQGAQETNYPMLNISKVQNRYQARVAIPVSKVLPDKGAIAFKRLIPGNILIAEVKGGTQTVEKSLQQMDYFVAEKGLSAPAIPFQSLVTNRLQEGDTSKWITRLYYPVY
jgi:hypothetical protein